MRVENIASNIYKIDIINDVSGQSLSFYKTNRSIYIGVSLNLI